MARKKASPALDADLGGLVEKEGWTPSSPEFVKRIEAMAKRGAMIRAQHGGSRPGAGRKLRPSHVNRVQISCTVAPETARRLRSLAKRKKVSLGAMLDRAAILVK